MLEVNKIYNLDNLEGLKQLENNSIDSIVTDPPYHLTQEKYKKIKPAGEHLDTPHGRSRVGARGFMGKEWDGGDIAFNVELWIECLRVLKPGGHLLAFGGSRTYHRMACAIEDAGFEIRDQIMWVYGSGFPKSTNISKEIDRKLGLKREVIGTSRGKGGENLNKISREGKGDSEDSKGCGAYGLGAKQIDIDIPVTKSASKEAEEYEGWGTALKPAHEPIVLARKPLSEKTLAENVLKWGTGALNINACRINLNGDFKSKPNGRPSQTGLPDNYDPNQANIPDTKGRWPANFILDEEAGELLDVQTKDLKKGFFVGRNRNKEEIGNEIYGARKKDIKDIGYGDSGGASRFFYCAKASKKERNGDIEGKNFHPTVKPIKLIEYLVKLVTSTNGLSLDIFNGSGTHSIACRNLGFDFIGFEFNKEYCEIAEARLQNKETEPVVIEDQPELF